MTKRIAVVVALVASSLFLGFQSQSEVSAQAGEVAWYRIVNQGRSAGTMPRWMRVGQGAAATFPFMDDFEVNIRPSDGLVNATIRDGQTQFMTTISCTRPNAPRRAMTITNRIGDDLPVIMVTLQCSDTQPVAR
ncbi:MAG: hypothetical protein ACI9KE_001213 [Polyangiales bacterium]|jgi:hypothetical protein